MLKRNVVLFAFGVAAILFGVSQTDAQPGKGPKGGDMQKIENELAQLLDQVKEIQAKLTRISAAIGSSKSGSSGKASGSSSSTESKKSGTEEKKGFGPGGFGPGGFGRGGFGRGGWGGWGGGFEKMESDMIKEKYEHYKKLYEESQAKSKAETKKAPEEKKFEFKFKVKGAEGKAPASDVEARIERLVRELEELRSELKNSKGPEDKKGFEGKKKFGKKFDQD